MSLNRSWKSKCKTTAKAGVDFFTLFWSGRHHYCKMVFVRYSYGFHHCLNTVSRITLWVSNCLPSLQARVTSDNSASLVGFFHHSWCNFHHTFHISSLESLEIIVQYIWNNFGAIYLNKSLILICVNLNISYKYSNSISSYLWIIAWPFLDYNMWTKTSSVSLFVRLCCGLGSAP